MGADEGDIWKGEKVGVKAVVGGRVEVMVVRKGKKKEVEKKKKLIMEGDKSILTIFILSLKKKCSFVSRYHINDIIFQE